MLLRNRGFEEIFSNAWFRRDFVITYFCLPRRKKYPEKVISLTFQANLVYICSEKNF